MLARAWLVSLAISAGCSVPNELIVDDSGTEHGQGPYWQSEAAPEADESDSAAGEATEPLLVEATPSAGAVPLSVSFEIRGVATGDLISWDFGDGSAGTGAQTSHTYLGAGQYQVTASLPESSGLELSPNSLTIDVSQAICPTQGQAEVLGEVESEAVDEASGLADSRQNEGVLWVHNDSGDGPYLYAMSHAGAHLGTWELQGVSAYDWEDLALGQDPHSGEHLLYIGDIGDNGESRDSVVVHRVPEPTVSLTAEEQGGTLEGKVLELEYPDGLSHNAESLLVDPVTDAIFIVTKSYAGDTGVFRKRPPHIDGEISTLDEVAWLDFSSEPLSGSATTGAEYSPLGDKLIIRTYGTTAYLWLRDGDETAAQVLSKDPCTIELPAEQQGETLAFSAAGDGLFSISEGTGQPVNWIPLEP